MDDDDRHVRNATYQLFIELGRAPEPSEVASSTGSSVVEVEAGWQRLHDAHALVLHASGGLRMAHPFSAVPTAFRVQAGGRGWFGSCAWDAIGICAALHLDGDIAAACPCCGDEIGLSIRDTQPSDESLLFHCLVPASAWWDDIAFT
jgi:alkylmercury lyase-like protein